MPISIPGLYQDPYSGQAISKLYQTSAGLLAGNAPDYYADIGKIGGEELENLLARTRKSTMRAVEENLASRNIRGGGISSSLIADAISGIESNIRYQDYVRALQGRLGLLSRGISGMSTVGQLGLNKARMVNIYNLNRAGLELDEERLALQKEMFEEEKEAQKDAMWADILSRGIGAVSNIYGINVLGKALKS